MNIGSRTNLATALSTWPLSLKALIRMISMFEARTTLKTSGTRSEPSFPLSGFCNRRAAI